MSLMRFYRPRILTLAVLCALAVMVVIKSDCPSARGADEAQDWRQFRGPAGAASGEASLPAEWDGHVRWRTELPGPGGSSPIVVGRRIFLTCYSGYGIDPGSQGDR